MRLLAILCCIVAIIQLGCMTANRPEVSIHGKWSLEGPSTSVDDSVNWNVLYVYFKPNGKFDSNIYGPGSWIEEGFGARVTVPESRALAYLQSRPYENKQSHVLLFRRTPDGKLEVQVPGANRPTLFLREHD